jgi:hypothetical protein
MLFNDLLKDLDFPDPGRLLQRTRGESTEVESRDGSFTDACIAVVGILVIALGVFGCVIMCRNRGAPVSTAGVNAMDTPYTLAERKYAILKLFEISQVTMVSYETVISWQGFMIRNSHKRSTRTLTISQTRSESKRGRYSWRR